MTTARVGVALSGGTAKTIAHIGVLEALEDAGVAISCIAGTSGGAANTARAAILIFFSLPVRTTPFYT